MYDSKIYYLKNKERIAAYNKKYQEEHREQLTKAAKEWRDKNRKRVRELGRISNKIWRANNPERVKINRYSTRDRLRTDILNAYGHKCQCCGVENKEFLAVDHINGGGNKHRKSLHPNASAQTMYTWLRKNNYPKEFQILCHNCNCAKAYYGRCPHNA